MKEDEVEILFDLKWWNIYKKKILCSVKSKMYLSTIGLHLTYGSLL